MKGAFIGIASLITVNAFAAARSMSVVGNDLTSAAELLGLSFLGPFTGWVFSSPLQQWLVCATALFLVVLAFLSRKSWRAVLVVVGVAVWLLPNAGPMSTGI